MTTLSYPFLALALLVQGLLPAPAAAAAETSLRFVERSEAWGLTFRHHHGGSGKRYMPETTVGGVVIFDYDGDGDHDVFFVDAGPLPGYEGGPPRSVLFRNDHGRFVDVTASSGLVVAGYGNGGTAADVDGDGHVDLYVTVMGPNQLFRNRGDGTFVDATAELGGADERWSSSAAFADVDRDGRLDLYVVSYVDFSVENHKRCTIDDTDIESYCHPDVYDGLPDRLFRNEGGRLVDVTEAAGLGGAVGPGLGLVFFDLDDDGWPDVYVANDLEGNFLFRNRGDGTFEDVSLLSGTSFGDRSQPEAGMGVDAGDVNGNGHLDLVVTNFEFETNGLYFNTGLGVFTDGRYRSRIAEPSIPMLGFGTDLADFDHDGDLDLVIANGHVLDNAHLRRPQSRYSQENQMFANRGNGVFDLVDAGLGEVVRVSRGLATGDLDLDGDLDFVVVNSNDWSEAWENVGARGSWLQVDLVASPSAPGGIGARLEATAGELSLREEARTATSYMSQNASSVHFGLRDSRVVDRLEVRWPRSRSQIYLDLPASRRVRLFEGRAELGTASGGDPSDPPGDG